jgi:hypothetical protein
LRFFHESASYSFAEVEPYLTNTGYKGMLLELSAEDYEQVKTEYYQAMLTHSDMDGEVELIADSNFVVVDR